MTSFEIERVPFDKNEVRAWANGDKRRRNWPIVYLIDAGGDGGPHGGFDDVYVGETVNVEGRMLQHLDSPSKQHLTSVRVIIDGTFNKSVCLDLESHLIRLLAGDGAYRVLNRNEGITDSDYYNREMYRESFRGVFERLRSEGIFTRSIPEIENSDLFKLSPFKALTQDQAVAVEDILDGLFADIESGAGSTIVIRGEPGTGKTVVAIYLLKLLADIRASKPDDEPDADSIFSDYFTDGHRELLQTFRIGLVVPQQSLRESIKRVFKRTPGLRPGIVLTPYDVGASDEDFDLLIVDEAHRLNQRANQASGVLNKMFKNITLKLFGYDDHSKTQLDWIRARSDHQILLVDAEQSVRPADLPPEVIRSVVDEASARGRYYPLVSQMRVRAGDDYVGYVRSILRPVTPATVAPAPEPRTFEGYDLRLFNDLGEMHDAIRAKDAEHGLARLVAGYAWEWKSRTDKTAYDIELDGRHLRWNTTDKDWINSPGSLGEVGSIHTVQGYDLNYAGVIIGPDLRYDPDARRLHIDRASYFDKKGKENNPVLGKTYSDEDLLRFITNVYTVLLTRGVRGTYVYVCDPNVRAYLADYLGGASAGLMSQAI